MENATASPKLAGTFDPNNLQVTFCNKTDKEIKLAYWLFGMMGKPALVAAGGAAAQLALKLKLPVKGLIRNTIYKHFCGGETVQEAQQVVQKLAAARIQTVLDYAAEAQSTEAGFDMVRDEVLQNIIIGRETKSFSLISVKLTGIGSSNIFRKLHLRQELTPEEQADFARTQQRLDDICQAATEANITVYLDAEESWLQNPMDELAEEMMRRYNTKRAVVFNTLQMYRTDRIDYLKSCLRRFEGEPVIVGIKIVRGAYLEKEQLRAKQQGYPCPVFTRKSDTDKSFNQAIDICLEHLHRVEFCAATHNEQSTSYLTSRIQEDSIRPYRHRIHFSQLYGMSDNLTYNLAAAGYNASKYLPYGEVATALPYLIRRAEENTSIAGQMGRELSLLQQEIKRRKL
ncbi:proline dehydrogenase family protein [Pontibacter chinhatensis]|uniref:L-proline dehydrogenase n=1 Tax=Pontibacter chinhatensis TaxID=1436961 RepID=A0A1I2S2K3_9BACT|nr:proline dehydrogenase family protein [Pontibacter chinhatensis]SFG46563.1 L-proline dehydrogenase [Pontibacter chinhatensis]